jgi:hypothetical protein
MRFAFAFVCMSVVTSGCDEKPGSPPPASTVNVAHASPQPTQAAQAAPSANASASTSTTLDLVPKTSFGPIRLGATKTEIEALGILKTHPQYSAMTIPYTVYYDKAGSAQRIQVSLKHAPADIKVGSVVIPRTATMDDVKKLLGDCKDEPPAIGGTTSKCRNGEVNVSIGSGSPTEVWIEAAR